MTTTTMHASAARDEREREAVTPAVPVVVPSASQAFFQRWWVAALVLPLMIASDWKFRRRVSTSALSGTADSQILIEVGIYGLIAAYLVLRRGRAPRLRRTSTLMFTMWFFGAFLAGSALYAVYPQISIVRGTQVLIICCVVQTISTRATVQDLHRFAHAYLMVVAFAVILGHAYTFPINNAVQSRFHWLYVHPVPGGMWLMIATLVAASYMRSAALRSVLNFWPRWIYTALFAWIGLALVLTKTRGSLAGFAVGFGLLLVLHTKAKTKLDVAAMATMLVGVLVMTFGGVILTYLERGQDVEKLATLNERTNLWAIALEKVAERPVTGFGLGASRGLFLDEIGLGGGHNAFVNVMVDVGLVGTTAFVTILVLVGVLLARFRRGTAGHRDAVMLFPVFIALLVNSMTAEFMAVPANNASIWLMLLCGWVTVLCRAQASELAARRRTLRQAQANLAESLASARR